jgi:hypothetical protein
MKEKTSVTLSPQVLERKRPPSLAGAKRARSLSSKISCVNAYGSGRARNQARAIELLNRGAEKLNRDAEDGLEDQARDQG